MYRGSCDYRNLLCGVRFWRHFLLNHVYADQICHYNTTNSVTWQDSMYYLGSCYLRFIRHELILYNIFTVTCRTAEKYFIHHNNTWYISSSKGGGEFWQYWCIYTSGDNSDPDCGNHFVHQYITLMFPVLYKWMMTWGFTSSECQWIS